MQLAIETILIAALVGVFARIFLLEPFVVSSISMEDTLIGGDCLFINKVAYLLKGPRPADVIVFRSPGEPSLHLVKRCVAVAGQSVVFQGEKLFVDGKVPKGLNKVRHTEHSRFQRSTCKDVHGEIQVSAGEIFVVGDNLLHSTDSRSWGPISEDHITGRAVFIYFSCGPSNVPGDISRSSVYRSAVLTGAALFRRVRWNRICMRVK